MFYQRIKNQVEFTGQDLVEAIYSHWYPVFGDSALRKIKGANLCRAISTADLAAALFSALVSFLFQCDLEQL